MTRSDQQVPDVVRTPDAAGGSDPPGPPRSQAQFFVPAPEDLPPPETVFGPGRRRSAGAIPDPADRRDVHAPHPDGDHTDPASDDGYPGSLAADGYPGSLRDEGYPGSLPDDGYRSSLRDHGYADPVPDGGRPGPLAGGRYADPRPGDRYGGPAPDASMFPGIPDAPVLGGVPGPPAAGPVPDAPVLAGVPDAPVLAGVPDAPVLAGVPDAPVLSPRYDDGPPYDDDPPLARLPAGPKLPAAHHAGAAPARPRRQAIDRRRLAVVYDIDGPRVRLGVAWFLGALVATLVPLPVAAAVVYAAAAGLAARQLVRAWGSVPWQADVAAGLGSVPVLAALAGSQAVVVTCALGAVVAIGCACAPDGARLPGGEGRVAAAGILCLSLVPALGAASFVLVRRHSVIAALVLLVVASAYEMGDYIVGSGGSTPIEGPLAGITTATLLALPLALVLVEPYDTAGVVLLPLTAVACPLGQVLASAVLPGAAAHAPALRRIDTLLLLAPVWAAAAGAI
jgi:hypothetical protein